MNKTYARTIQDCIAAYYQKYGHYPINMVIDKDRFYEEAKDWVTIPNPHKGLNQVFGVPTIDINDTLIIPPPNDE